MRIKITKFLVFFLSALVVMLLLAGAISQTRLFKDWLRTLIIGLGNDAINGDMRLGRIDGNLLTRLSFTDFAIILRADTVVYVPRLDIVLHPVSLMRRELRLSHIEMHAPRLALKQVEDGSLNLSHLLRSSDGPASSAWAVQFGVFSINDARIEYVAIDTIRQFIPRRIQLRKAEISGSFVDDRLTVQIKHLQLETFLPGLEVKALTTEVDAAGDSLRLKNINLVTTGSTVQGEIAVPSFKSADFTVHVQLAPLLLDELHSFMPNLQTRGAVSGRLNVTQSHGALRVNTELAHASAIATISGTLDNIDSTYSIEGVLQQVDLSEIGLAAMPRSSINARFTAEGRGFDWPRAFAHTIVWFDTSRIAAFQLPRFEIDARLDHGRLQTHADYFSPLGSAALDAEVEDIFGEQLHRFAVSLNKFDLTRFYARLMGKTSIPAADSTLLQTTLSLSCAGTGRSFDPQKMQLSLRLDAAASEIGLASIDSLTAFVRVQDQVAHIDSLLWRGPTADVSASGAVSFALESDVQFHGTLDDLDLIRRLVEADSLRAGGTFSGNMFGKADSIVVNAVFALQNVVWNSASMKNVNGKMDFHSIANGGTVTADAGGLLLGMVPLDTATAIMHYDFAKLTFQSTLSRGADSRGEIDGRYTFGDTARLDIDRADIFLVGQKWQKPESPMWIDIGNEAYQLHNVILQSAGQRVFAQGLLDYLGEEDLVIGIDNLNLASIAGFMGRGEDFAGVANASAKFFGSASSPLLQGKFEIRDGRISEFRFPMAQGSLGYADNRFFWDVELQQNATLSLIGEGFLPMNLALDNDEDILLRDRPMRLQFHTNGLEFSFLQTIFPKLKNLHGLLAFNLSAENTPAKLQPAGYLQIYDAGFAVPAYGINYQDIQLAALIDSNFIELQNLHVTSGDGTLSADGRVDFVNSTVNNLVAAVRANNFLVIHNRDADVRINADIRVGGTIQGAGFAGDLTVARSRFFLPALQPKSVLQVDEPVKTTSPNDTAKAQVDPMRVLLANSYGELRVLIPRNTWLRGPEMNVEIEGELDLLINENDLLLFGAINVVRGTYELQGSKFTIDQGSLIFQGNKDMMPEIDLKASKAFRHAYNKQKQTLRLLITGRADAPKIAFQLDDEGIEEKDALAYLLFGVSFDELTQGQKQETDKLTSSVATGLLAGVVSKQISNVLAKSLSLDVIEFQSGENLELNKSRVLVGKYITNDLFLSYSRDFSSADAQKVSLEYEIAKFLFLQAAKSNEKDTGFDLIWKWEW